MLKELHSDSIKERIKYFFLFKHYGRAVKCSIHRFELKNQIFKIRIIVGFK